MPRIQEWISLCLPGRMSHLPPHRWEGPTPWALKGESQPLCISRAAPSCPRLSEHPFPRWFYIPWRWYYPITIISYTASIDYEMEKFPNGSAISEVLFDGCLMWILTIWVFLPNKWSVSMWRLIVQLSVSQGSSVLIMVIYSLLCCTICNSL